MNLTSIHEDTGLMSSLSGLRIWRCCELWYRPAATALFQPLAWKPPYAGGAALRNKRDKNKDIQKQMYEWGKWESEGHAQGKNQKRPAKTLVLHIKLILTTGTVYGNQNQTKPWTIISNNNKKQQTLGKRQIWFPEQLHYYIQTFSSQPREFHKVKWKDST